MDWYFWWDRHTYNVRLPMNYSTSDRNQRWWGLRRPSGGHVLHIWGSGNLGHWRWGPSSSLPVQHVLMTIWNLVHLLLTPQLWLPHALLQTPLLQLLRSPSATTSTASNITYVCLRESMGSILPRMVGYRHGEGPLPTPPPPRLTISTQILGWLRE